MLLELHPQKNADQCLPESEYAETDFNYRVLITYPDGTPDSTLSEAKNAIEIAVS